jgi:uncharacterized protein (DUF1778 family)
MSASETAAQQQVSLSMSSADRELIERAADLAGQPFEEFVRSEAVRSARQLLRDHAVIRLTTRGWEQLAALIETEEQPGEALLRAAESNPDVRPVAAPRPT